MDEETAACRSFGYLMVVLMPMFAWLVGLVTVGAGLVAIAIWQR